MCRLLTRCDLRAGHEPPGVHFQPPVLLLLLALPLALKCLAVEELACYVL